LNDLLWIFTLNILISGFNQFRFTENGSDLALAIIFLLAFLISIGALFVYRVHQYKKDPTETL
jgi:hypothetical protein